MMRWAVYFVKTHGFNSKVGSAPLLFDSMVCKGSLQVGLGPPTVHTSVNGWLCVYVAL